MSEFFRITEGYFFLLMVYFLDNAKMKYCTLSKSFLNLAKVSRHFRPVPQSVYYDLLFVFWRNPEYFTRLGVTT